MRPPQRHLLYCNASAEEREQVRTLLADSEVSWEISDAPSMEACEEALQARSVDAILANFCPDGFRQLPCSHPSLLPLIAGTPLILLVDPQLESEALAALANGATDYVLWTPAQLRRLPTALKLAVAAASAAGAKSPPAHPACLGHNWQSSTSAVLDTLPIGVVILDGRGFVEFVNAAWNGFTRADSQRCLALDCGDNFLQAIESLEGGCRAESSDRSTPSMIADALRSILAGSRESYSIEFRPAVYVDPRWYRLQAAALDHGGTRGVLVTCAEVTQRVAAESQVHFQSQLLANIHDAVCATDTSAKITAWNASAERLYGWSAAEVVGKQLEDIVPCPRSADGWEVVFGSAQASQPYRNDLVHCTRDGRRINVAAVSVPLRDAAGAVLGYVVTVRDMTDRTLALEAAWENEARWQLAGRAANEAICDLDLRTGQVWRSEGYHRLFGYQPEELLAGIGWWLKQIHPDDIDRVWRHSEAVFGK